MVGSLSKTARRKEGGSDLKQYIGRKEDYLTAKDVLLMIIITGIYAIISFINLGSFSNPQTFWEAFTENEKITLELQSGQQVSKMRIFTGPVTGEYTIYKSDNTLNLGEKVLDVKPKAVFAWEDITTNIEGKYISIVAKTKGSYLGEVALYDKDNNILTAQGTSPQSGFVVDEKNVVPDKISYLNSTYFDEIYHARTAYEHIHHLKPYEWTHPPLGKIIMGIPVALMGMTPFAYRLMGNLVGILMIPLIYLFAKRIFKNTGLAVLAGLLMACDGMHFVQTRIATVDSYLVFFIMLAYLFMYEYMRTTQYDSMGKKLSKLLLSGIFMGCAIATKWTGTYAALGLCILFFYDFMRRNNQVSDRHIWKRQSKQIISWCFLFFIFIPVGIYIASYIPFFITQNSDVNSFGELIKMQGQMYNYHAKLTATHPFASEWYKWPLDIRPVWYYDGQQAAAGKISTIAAFGNPIIWWLGIIGIIYTIKEAIVNREVEDIFLVVAILAAYIPYIFIGRVMFIYHYFPVVPFMMLAIVKLMKDITAKRKSTAFLIIYGSIVVISFIFFYPVYSGMEVPKLWVMLTAWLPTWGYFKG